MNEFLDDTNKFAVIGVSRDTSKYGRIVYEKLKSAGFIVYGINPKINLIDGEKIYSDISELEVDVVVFVVPPKVVESVLPKILEMGINMVWMQPGSESDEAIRFCEKNGIKCLHDQCIMLNV